MIGRDQKWPRAAVVAVIAALTAGCASAEASIRNDEALPLKQRSLNTLDQASQRNSQAE